VDELRVGYVTGVKKGSRLIVRRASILHAELGNRHIAYVTSQAAEFGGEQQMHVRNLSTGTDTMVYRARSGGANFANITRASYVATPDAFVWARTNIGSQTGNRIVRYRLHGSKLDYARGSSHYVSTAWAGDTLGAVTTGTIAATETPDTCVDNGVNYCGVMLSGPLAFNLKP